ncbi:MAG TPA: roadblock/LC7 domain-containing protein [Chthoniobacteraceae bacterium]|nr:roadblock/LC7 domain-containing protein [Chthoniobacteraceae bacterium]
MIPRINEEDIARFDAVLRDLVEKSEASVVLIVERAGYLIHQHGQLEGFEPTQVATLASNAFAATEFMANLIQEPDFSGMYQQGSTISTVTLNINPSCLLFVAFESRLSVGAIKFFCGEAVKQLAAQLEIAERRAPGDGIDLSDLNPESFQTLFQRDPPPATGA